MGIVGKYKLVFNWIKVVVEYLEDIKIIIKILGVEVIVKSVEYMIIFYFLFSRYIGVCV